MSELIIGATGHHLHKLKPKPECYSKAFCKELTTFAKVHLDGRSIKMAISGMTLGWDTAVAIAAIQLDIPLIAAVSFRGQERAWPIECQRLYHRILERASKVVLVSSGGYSAAAMNRRNR